MLGALETWGSLDKVSGDNVFYEMIIRLVYKYSSFNLKSN